MSLFIATAIVVLLFGLWAQLAATVGWSLWFLPVILGLMSGLTGIVTIGLISRRPSSRAGRVRV